MIYSKQTKNGLQAKLPHAVEVLDHTALLELRTIRNHINALEAQSYFNEVNAIFDCHPDLIEINMENASDDDDDHRYILIIAEDLAPGADVSEIDNALFECAETLNNLIRHRGIYDYIDALVGPTKRRIISRDTVQDVISKAFDTVNDEPGAWEKSRAHFNALRLQGSTQAAESPPSRPRI